MRQSKTVVRIGDVSIGGQHPIAVQSMTKTKTADLKRTVMQIHRLESAGCELVRCAVVNKDDLRVLPKIRKAIKIPLIADIHFDYRLALGAIGAGVDKLRINPGNIVERWKLEEIIKSAKDNNIPIRIGINSGSLPEKVLARHGRPTVAAIVQAAKEALSLFADCNFTKVVISAKGVDVRDTVQVYKLLSEQFDFPLHVGITEAGLVFDGAVKSAVGLGIILYNGIGDTIRVSLTADPVREVLAAYTILSALGLREHGPVLISCPMCGRCEVDMAKIAGLVDKRLKRYKHALKVAVMGCVVNGPGEARDADFGIACGKGVGSVFSKGKEIRRVKESNLVDALFEVIDENLDI